VVRKCDRWQQPGNAVIGEGFKLILDPDVPLALMAFIMPWRGLNAIDRPPYQAAVDARPP